jgi:hypothetical protein
MNMNMSSAISFKLDSRPYSNRLANKVILGMSASRENLAIGRQNTLVAVHDIYILFFISVSRHIIDENLCVFKEYCKKPNHESCIHAEIWYDESFRLHNKFLTEPYNDKLSIPKPEVSHAVWRMLNQTIETRAENQMYFLCGMG